MKQTEMTPTRVVSLCLGAFAIVGVIGVGMSGAGRSDGVRSAAPGGSGQSTAIVPPEQMVAEMRQARQAEEERGAEGFDDWVDTPDEAWSEARVDAAGNPEGSGDEAAERGGVESSSDMADASAE